MTKEPPLWAFKCGTYQDEDGRFRMVTADGIWLGYLKRLASARYASPAEVCTSVRDRVRAASIHPSEWVRRFLRMTLKQPAKATFIKGVQLNSAKRALAFLCPLALPHVLETELPEDRRTQLVRLRTFLGLLWDLERATLPLVKGIVTRTKKPLSARGNMRPAVLETHQLTLQRLHAWLVHVEEADAGGVVAAGGIAGAGNGGGDGAIADGGLHDDGEAEDEDGDVGAAPDQPPPAMPAVVPVAAAGSHETSGRAAGPNIARRPAAAARSHHVARSTNEPLDPRCLRPRIKALGASLYRDITSFAIAVTIDPVVNAFKPRHVGALKKLADVLQAADGFAQVRDLKRRVALVTDAPLPPATPDAPGNAPEPVAAETIAPADAQGAALTAAVNAVAPAAAANSIANNVLPPAAPAEAMDPATAPEAMPPAAAADERNGVRYAPRFNVVPPATTADPVAPIAASNTGTPATAARAGSPAAAVGAMLPAVGAIAVPPIAAADFVPPAVAINVVPPTGAADPVALSAPAITVTPGTAANHGSLAAAVDALPRGIGAVAVPPTAAADVVPPVPAAIAVLPLPRAAACVLPPAIAAAGTQPAIAAGGP